MDQGYNLLGVIRVLLKWKNQILIVTVAAGIITAIVSFLALDDYYKSYATVYPINMGYNDPAAVFNQQKVDFFGDKNDANRLLTIAQSASVRDSIISRYKLVSHYKIDTTKKYWRTKVQKEYDGNYKAQKTDQGAIEVSIFDTDPKMAADIITTVVQLMDNINCNNILQSKRKQVETFAGQISAYEDLVAKYADTLASLGSQYHIQVKTSSDQAGSEVIEGADYKAVQIYKAIYARQKNAFKRLNESSNIKKEVENSLSNDSKSLAEIDMPTVADKKEKPMRSIITLLAMMLTFVFSIFGVLLIDQIQEIRKQL